jgi:prepilin-type processing-associated H-X9-DG protein
VGRPTDTIFLVDGWTTTGWRLGPLPRHWGGLNVGFLDGHARRLPMPELGHVDADENGGRFWFRYAAADR